MCRHVAEPRANIFSCYSSPNYLCVQFLPISYPLLLCSGGILSRLGWSIGMRVHSIRLLTTNYNTTTEDSITVHFGIWYRQSVELYNYKVDSESGGYYKVSTCTGYREEINIDPSWKAARAFSILVLTLGGIALVLALAICCCANKKYASNINRLNGGIYLLVTIFQGLTLIILSSKLCQNNNDDIRQMMGQDNAIYSFQDECNLSEEGPSVSSLQRCFGFSLGCRVVICQELRERIWKRGRRV